MIGGPGKGKNHLASGIDVQAIEQLLKRVRFFSTIELVNTLELEVVTGKLEQMAFRLMYVDLNNYEWVSLNAFGRSIINVIQQLVKITPLMSFLLHGCNVFVIFILKFTHTNQLVNNK